MEPTLFAFIWKHSRRQQMWLLLVTLMSFPFLYASLQLPKMIVNDAIGSVSATVSVFGMRIGQVQYLVILCGLFLATVLIGGLLKMYLNTRKGILSERMLRRLRYRLIHRMLRFPRPYFRTTSQGELVAMIASEAEPMGGLMGDAIAQPVFQFGQMMTIVGFLFLQSVWFGLAAVALIPLQAWLIPMLQRQINLLNKDRIVEVRHLASEIGETAAGISDLRANGGMAYRLAQFTDRLGRLFELRFLIYRKKYFMKFLNNLITQITPFLFYLIGGYLAIRGEITVGALVAALGAYKDLSGPWRDLLTFYNQVQEMALRWDVMMERFAPPNMIPETLVEGTPDDIPHLRGPIEIANVTVADQDGTPVLEEIDLTIPEGGCVAIRSHRGAERAALAQLLVREVLPTRGRVTLAGQRLDRLHQAVIAARIGYAHSSPYLFDGTLGDNLLMPLRIRPGRADADSPRLARLRDEAARAGNSTDLADGDWADPAIAGLADMQQVRDLWYELIQVMKADDYAFRRNLRARLDTVRHSDLAGAVVGLRPEIARRLRAAGLMDAVHRFDPEGFNPAIPLGGNLLFASPSREITQDGLAREAGFFAMLDDLGIAQQGVEIAAGVVETLNRTFGQDDTGHPLFRRLGIDETTYHRLTGIVQRRRLAGESKLSAADRALLLTVVFLMSAEQIGPGFADEYKDRILAIRKSHAARLLAQTGDMFVPFREDRYIPRLTLLENAVYGRMAMATGGRADAIEELVAETLTAHGLRRQIVSLVFDMSAGLGGTNLPPAFQQRAGFGRAAIKRPDILIMDGILAAHAAADRRLLPRRLREIFPETTMIFLEDEFDEPQAWDMFVELRDGRIDGAARLRPAASAGGAADLDRKLDILSDSDLFGALDARNRRLLAFSAAWFDAAPAQAVFSHGQSADAVYLCLSGRAEMRLPNAKPGDPPVYFVGPGRLIGDLAVIAGGHRMLDLVAVEPTRFLRIGADEFRAVIASDAKVALRLLEEMARHLTGATEMLQMAQINLADFATPADAPPGPLAGAGPDDA
ncbi:MAG: cyclic nucleotide-binding domain-containing protein [Rhodobacteraceae bacterium]|nr:cyclic nucleotide-binding domain-containing protein [Paracoccaceae bacterium]